MTAENQDSSKSFNNIDLLETNYLTFILLYITIDFEIFYLNN